MIIVLVGESGCGKSVSQMSVMQLVQTPPGKILGGEVLFEGKNLLSFSIICNVLVVSISDVLIGLHNETIVQDSCTSLTGTKPLFDSCIKIFEP